MKKEEMAMSTLQRIIDPHSINPIAYANRTFDGKPLTLDKNDAAELEFSSQSHLVVLLTDGISGGCEWSNGSQTGKLSSVAPNTIIRREIFSGLGKEHRNSATVVCSS
jgi:hypothetical protein